MSISFSSRKSPVITRSSSRLSERASRHSIIEKQTPRSRVSDYIDKKLQNTIERQSEVADDDLDESLIEDQWEHNSSLDVKSSSSKETGGYNRYFKNITRLFTSVNKPFMKSLLILSVIVISQYFILENPLFENRGSRKYRELAANISELHIKIIHLSNYLDQLSKTVDELKYLRPDVLQEEENRDNLYTEIEKLKDAIEEIKMSTPEPRIVYFNEESKDSSTSGENVAVFNHNNHVNNDFKSINVANRLLGAEIDYSATSRGVSTKSSLILDALSYLKIFDAGYAILDRDVIVPGDAWCTYDNEPKLTIKLAKYIIPTMVSYQHVKWRGVIPHTAPKLYDVMVCESEECSMKSPLALNCTYEKGFVHEEEQEQMCAVSKEYSANSEPINYVQFQFHGNHGSIDKTCVYLVRVYGEIVEPLTDVTSKDDVGNDISKRLVTYIKSFSYINTILNQNYTIDL